MKPDATANRSWKELMPPGRVPLVVVRHGQTAWNAERRFLGRSDIALDETGMQQVERVSRFLKPIPFSEAFSSPLRRATQTAAAILQGRGLPLQLDPRLAELDQGHLEGEKAHILLSQYGEFFAAWQKDPATCRVPGGESFSECQARGVEAFTAIARQGHPGTPILIVTHNMLIRAVVCAIRGLPLSRFGDIEQDNTAVNLFSHGNDGFEIHSINQQPSPASP